MVRASRNQIRRSFFAVCLLGAAFLSACNAQTQKTSQSVLEVNALEIRSTSKLQDFKTEGTLSASREIILKSQIKGHIGDTFVAASREVSANESILSLRLEEMEFSLQAKQSELKATEAELESVQVDRDALSAKEEGSDKDDSLAAHERALTLKLDQIQDEIDLLSYQLKQGTLIAPFDGVLSPVKDLYADQPIAEGEELYRLVAFNPLTLKFLIPSDYAKDLSEGTGVVMTPYNDPTQKGTGTITALAPYAQNHDLVAVVAQVDNANRSLKSGQSGEVRVMSESKRAVLLVPKKAILTSQIVKGDQVFVVRGDHVVLTPITLGRPHGEQIEVTTGLRLGDWVAVSELDTLVNNQTVKVNRLR